MALRLFEDGGAVQGACQAVVAGLVVEFGAQHLQPCIGGAQFGLAAVAVADQPVRFAHQPVVIPDQVLQCLPIVLGRHAGCVHDSLGAFQRLHFRFEEFCVHGQVCVAWSRKVRAVKSSQSSWPNS